ncbi:MAG: ankyrin repeat domain-containing protein [Gammaproteobacteria bacterium]|nr:ankyrin repeat domain-containing protein [Gammaproteobacteria bacterium]
MKKTGSSQDKSAAEQTSVISITPDNAYNPFIVLGRDVHSHMIQLSTIKDAVSLSRSCTSLWVKSQGALFRLFLRNVQSELNNDAFAYLHDAIELDDNFNKFKIDFKHLAKVLNSALPVLTSFIRNDLRAAPKFAAICGKKSAVEEILGDKITASIDSGNHCIASYYAVGDQLECLIDFYVRWPEVFLHHIDAIAHQAALGGSIPILKYLKETHKYDLRKVYPKRAGEFVDETLLTSAVKGGHEEMIDFLITEGVSPYIGLHLAVVASTYAHWKLYDRFSEEEHPLSGYLDDATIQKLALCIAGNALRTGKLELGLSLMKQYHLDAKTLFMHVIEGGRAEIFWHFINSGLVSLTDRFKNEATVEHLLVKFGHLSLLKEVLKDPRPKNGVLAVDGKGRSSLHYAGKGGHYNMYTFLLPFFENALQKDQEGNTVAHTAAASGSVWFLKLLMLSETGRIMMKGKCAKNNKGETVLHSAAKSNDANLICMIVEDENCGIDLFSTDKRGLKVFNKLASLAMLKESYWSTISALVVKYGVELIDSNINGAPGNNVRVVMEAFKAEKYFPSSALIAPTKK